MFVFNGLISDSWCGSKFVFNCREFLKNNLIIQKTARTRRYSHYGSSWRIARFFARCEGENSTEEGKQGTCKIERARAFLVVPLNANTVFGSYPVNNRTNKTKGGREEHFLRRMEGRYRPQDRLDRSSRSFYSIAYVTQRTNEEGIAPLFPQVSSLRESFQLLPRFATIRFCGNVHPRLRARRFQCLSIYPSLFLSFSPCTIFSVYNYAAVCCETPVKSSNRASATRHRSLNG